ncbi:FUSC family protein [Methylobacterium sp. yr668]|uniref:FUSC family protein n=1 Tax=Methylobacterium sp. yr668 TaxID=1761801 RepID=UPI0008E1E38E|nr:FUSC family protein [Methylobacterium sp. yr668]SFT30087.1 Fusaric acid resistance protein family protein [Methylobacterium sp. yr668]
MTFTMSGKMGGFLGLHGTSVPFGLRSALTALAVLWLAMWLQLETPRWAAWTVLALALPTRGQVGRKGLSRVAGTLVGLVAGLAGMALFSQSPIAMGMYLSSWFALSTYVSGRLPGFASYGAALAGLTAGFVVLLSAPAPLTAFDTALERGAEIVIGVGCVYVASAIAEIVQGKSAPPIGTSAPLPELASVWANTLRTFLVVGSTWAIWMATAWPSGGVFVLFAGVVSIIFVTIPDGDRRARGYLWGAGLGQFAGIAVRYELLASAASFELLALTLFPLFFMGAVGMTEPRTTPPALGYNLSFLIAVAPTNPMQYDLAASLNESVAVFAGIAFAAAAFRIILPERIWRGS